MDIKVLGRMDHTKDNTFELANRVYDEEGISPTIPTNSGSDHIPKIMDVEEIPKIKIRQATEQGFVECEVGGGGRFKLPEKPNTQRQGGKEWADMSDTDNGEYP